MKINTLLLRRRAPSRLFSSTTAYKHAMAPALTLNDSATDSSTTASSIEAAKSAAKALARPTSILYRTPWRPPVAKSAHGMYVELEDGRTVYDAVGGAAVACIGNGHPAVVKAMKDQIDRVSCVYSVNSEPV